LPRPIAAARAAPEWLVDESFEDEPVGVLKSGKEAEVFLVERHYPTTSRLFAHKRFRPRHPGKGELRELGFSKGTIYRADKVYRAGWNLNARDQRAVAARSSYGDEIISHGWPANEFAMLLRAWQAGASVPYPVEPTSDGFLMEFIGGRIDGDDEAPIAAPRLADARPDGADLISARDQLLQSLAALTRAQVVHADLSVYNLLWWEGRLVVIDFPQAIDATTNPAGPDLLHRDLMNVAAWFERRGAPIDVERVFADLVVELIF
jgi:RIO kinase 1